MATRAAAAAKSWCDFVSRSLWFSVWRKWKRNGRFGRFVTPLVRSSTRHFRGTYGEGREDGCQLRATSGPPACPSSPSDIRLLQASNESTISCPVSPSVIFFLHIEVYDLDLYGNPPGLAPPTSGSHKELPLSNLFLNLKSSACLHFLY
jgi:hypothetical protein